MKKTIKASLTVLISLLIAIHTPLAVFASEATSETKSAETGQTTAQSEETNQTQENPSGAFHYEHDPMENPNAAKDIVVNPDAIYGYSPNPESQRLGAYADALDWTDAEQVAAAREERAAYLEENRKLFKVIEDMLGQGKNVEEIAREVSRQRNENRLAAYNGDPEGLALVKKSNLETYGQEEGPTPDQLYEKYGSWQIVIEKALSPNAGMDACLGFYDENYDMYDLSEMFDDADQTETSEEASDHTAGEETAENPAPASESTGETYTVKKGDSLWKIAADKLGDGQRWKEIYELNKESINNPRLIYPGQEFILPAA